MSDVETSVRNIALPLIEGDITPRTFTERELTRLAAWCFLKAVTLELGRPPYERPTHRPEMYSGFKKLRQPPAGSVILIGHRKIEDGERPTFVWFKSERQTQLDPVVGSLDRFRTAITIKHLVIEIVGVFNVPAVKLADHDPRLIQIWPTPRRATWPPAEEFRGVSENDLF
jgi:hypothetical protein